MKSMVNVIGAALMVLVSVVILFLSLFVLINEITEYKQ
jgi:hypothetical protein